jgi:hypothetical protein
MSRDDQAFDDWKRRADQCDLLATAVIYGATLKRHGREHIGPCAFCGGTDRFSINPSKNLWHCRGHGGGHGAIGMVMHMAGMSFTQTCEALTGESNASGAQAKPLSEGERAARNRQRIENERAQQARKEQEERYQEDTKEAAARIWGASISVHGTIAEKYLNTRGIPTPEGWGPCLRFHPNLPYPKRGEYPALVCHVEDLAGATAAVWRIYLRADGRKADVPDAKLGLGPAGGGAVRLGGMGRKIGIAEGVETALGAALLTGNKFPVWAALSTSGMIGLEVPLGVEHVVIFPDGDRPLRKKGEEYEPAVPAGRKAAVALRARLLVEGIACTIAAEPGPGRDYLDLWRAHSMEDV